MTDGSPMTPPELLAARRNKAWKPDPQGRLVFRPRGIAGPAYVVETTEQLAAAERFTRTKMTLGVVTVGAVLGSVLSMQSSDDLAGAIGSVAVVLALVAALVFHSVFRWRHVIERTGMRRVAS